MGRTAAAAREHLTVTLRALGTDDLPFVVEGHRRALPHGFFVRLGPRFLARYHQGFVDGPHAVSLLAEVDGRPAGALVGTADHRAHYRWLLRRRGPVLALAGVAALVVRPRELADFMRGRLGRYARAVPRLATESDGRDPNDTDPAEASGRVTRATTPAPTTPAEGPASSRSAAPAPLAVLQHMFVADEHRGAGVGRALVGLFEERAAAVGASECRLVTLAGPRGASTFYRRLGWRVRRRRRDREGRAVVHMAKPLPDGAARTA
jgi:GNAT superfamily N-acetyltransferase